MSRLIRVIFSLAAFGCEGGNGSSVDFAPADEPLVFHEPPNDSSIDAEESDLQRTTRARCLSICNHFGRLGCESSNDCSAECREAIEADPCGLEGFDLIACILDRGLCPEEVEDPLENDELEPCSGLAREYSRCTEAASP